MAKAKLCEYVTAVVSPSAVFNSDGELVSGNLYADLTNLKELYYGKS